MKKILSLVIFLSIFALLLNSEKAMCQWNLIFDKNTSCNALMGNDIYIGTDSGIYRSTDSGTNWIYIEGFRYIIDELISKDNYLFAATIYGIFMSTNNGMNWIQQTQAPFTSAFINNGNTLFAGEYERILSTTNNGTNWIEYSLPGVNTVEAFTINNNNSMFAGTTLSGVFITTNNGVNWLQTSLNNKRVLSLAAKENYVFATTYTEYSGAVVLTTNNGINWIQTSLSSNTSFNPLYVNGDNIFVGSQRKVLLSTNNGNSFAEIFNEPYQIVGNVRTIFVANNFLFVGARDGVWRRNYVEFLIPSTPTLLSPVNNSLGLYQPITLKWSKAARAETYKLLISTDPSFNNIVYTDSTIADTTKIIPILNDGTKYYWKIRANNSYGSSEYSSIRNFTTLGSPNVVSLFYPSQNAINIPLNPTFKWRKGVDYTLLNVLKPSTTKQSLEEIQTVSKYWFELVSDTVLMTGLVSDSTLTDTIKTLNGLIKNRNYYWRVKAKNEIGWNVFSNWWKFTTMPNLNPNPNVLTSIFNSNAGRELTQNYTFTSSGSTDPDGTIDSVQWFVNYTKVSTDTLFTYAYPQGTTFVKLLVIDNEGARDSSTARVTRTVFRKYLGGPVYAGLSLTGDSVMYAIASNDKVYRMDIDGNILYNLSVNGNILSSSSIAYDTSVFIGSSDNNLYGFSRYGAPLWPVLPLGGQITATPTLDSATNRIYIGTSNGFLQVVNRNTGNIAWSSFVGGSAVQGSAVITFDRKLVLFNAKGDLYGFDLNSTATTYTWFILSSDSVKTSPAIDNTGNIYIGTRGGKLKKITLPTGQAGNVVWEVNLGSPINTSPIIDETGNIYVGLQNGQFKKVNSSNGATIWTFNTTGSINTTPALSRLNKIYFGNTNGEIIALDSSKNVLWYYKDSSAIGNALLFSKGTVYAGTTAGRVIAIYDGTNLTDDPNLNPAAPMWGTYQGNNRRTGSQIDVSVGIFSPVTEIPKEYFVSNNYPNPFNPATRIKYGIPAESDVRMVIYDMLGREVKVLVNEKQKAGTYEVTFNASFLPSGVYFYRIAAKDFVQTKRMVLLK